MVALFPTNLRNHFLFRYSFWCKFQKFVFQTFANVRELVKRMSHYLLRYVQILVAIALAKWRLVAERTNGVNTVIVFIVLTFMFFM